jgi:predicted DNA-binding protein YlxM (UPF0122 family)
MMPSGHYLSKEQIEYIDAHKDELTPGQIAKRLMVKRRCVLNRIRQAENANVPPEDL